MHSHGKAQLISYTSPTGTVRATYSWLTNTITKVVKALGLLSFSSHSLRRGGASAMHDASLSLIDIKNLGDWHSLLVLQYLSKSPRAKIDWIVEFHDLYSKCVCVGHWGFVPSVCYYEINTIWEVAQHTC